MLLMLFANVHVLMTAFMAARWTGSVVVSAAVSGLVRARSDWPVLVFVLVLVLEHARGQRGGGEKERGK